MKRMDIIYAKGFLMKNLHRITNISQWAEFMGYTRYNFSRSFRSAFSESPKEAFHKIRMQHIIITLLRDPDRKFYDVALDYGFKDEKVFYDYVKYHRNISPSEIKAMHAAVRTNKSTKKDKGEVKKAVA